MLFDFVKFALFAELVVFVFVDVVFDVDEVRRVYVAFLPSVFFLVRQECVDVCRQCSLQWLICEVWTCRWWVDDWFLRNDLLYIVEQYQVPFDVFERPNVCRPWFFLKNSYWIIHRCPKGHLWKKTTANNIQKWIIISFIKSNVLFYLNEFRHFKHEFGPKFCFFSSIIYYLFIFRKMT